MWRSIKKFFKWIADHTGISWIFKRFSSNQRPDDKMSQTNKPKSLAGNSLDNRVRDLLQDKPGVFDIIKKGEDRCLVLHVGANYVSKVVCGSIENIKENLSGYPVYIKCDKGVFKVTLGRVLFSNAFYSSFNVCSMMTYGCDISYNGLEEMKSMLGLLNKAVTITQISKDLKELSNTEIPNGTVVKQYESQSSNVAIPRGAKLEYCPELSDYLSRARLERDRLLFNAMPNKSHVLEKQAEEEFHDVEDDGITQPSPVTFDMDEEGDKYFDAEEPSSTIKVSATGRHYITSPSTGGIIN